MIVALDLVHELLGAVTAVAVVTAPIMVRAHYASKATDAKLDTIYRAVNGVEEHEATTDDLAALREEVRAGFARMEAQSERVEPSPQPRKRR